MKEASKQYLARLYSYIANEYALAFGEVGDDSAIVDDLIARLDHMNTGAARSRILDAGCGPGTFAQYVNDRGFEVVGIDVADAMLDIATKRLPSCTFRNMIMQSLEFDAQYFEAVMATYSLIHVPKNEVGIVLREFARVTKPNGYLLLIGQRGESDHLERDPIAPEENLFVNYFNEHDLKTDLEANGFSIEIMNVVEGQNLQFNSDALISVIAKRNSN